MKKVLLFVLLAGLVLGLLASPAFAAKSTGHYRLPEGVPLLPAYGGGWWFEYNEATGDPNLDLTWWQAAAMPPTGDADMDAAWNPIPKGSTAIATLGWIGTSYGQTQSTPKALDVTIDVSGPAGFSQHVGPDEVATMWTGAYLYDEWWQDFGGPYALFNPHIANGTYINRPIVPVGPFATEGWYHFSLNIDQVRPFVDHMYWDFDEDGMADSPGATVWLPGSMLIEYDFYVE